MCVCVRRGSRGLFYPLPEALLTASLLSLSNAHHPDACRRAQGHWPQAFFFIQSKMRKLGLQVVLIHQYHWYGPLNFPKNTEIRRSGSGRIYRLLQVPCHNMVACGKAALSPSTWLLGYPLSVSSPDFFPHTKVLQTNTCVDTPAHSLKLCSCSPEIAAPWQPSEREAWSSIAKGILGSSVPRTRSRR